MNIDIPSCRNWAGRRAANRTNPQFGATVLRLLFQSGNRKSKLKLTLPSFHSGGWLVDIADRHALNDAIGRV
jgi:hypothetical protein